MTVNSVKSPRNKQAGFSLIELMIVVAIIGILATIAIPNFNRFQFKARQSEAKANLTALFMGQKAFYTEWTSYASDFRDIGVNLEGTLRYHVGFNGPNTFSYVVGNLPGFNPSNAGLCAAGGTNTSAVGAGGGCACINTAGVIGSCILTPGMAFAAAAAAGSCAANGAVAPTRTAFVASANGTIAAVGGSRDDRWTITDAKITCNNQSGL